MISRLAKFARGVHVLDLSAFLPGPLAGLLLADMGAEVLKVEPPAGDPMATLGPRDAEGGAVFYEAVNAGKRVRRMDLKQDEVREEFLRMILDFDVLIEGFRPGVMARLGLGYDVLQAVNPGLIMCSLSGYGAEGPRVREAGHDANYLAGSGVMYRNGSPPTFYDPPIADVSGSLFAVIAILGALRAREADGQGCAIDIGLADTPMPLQLFDIAGHGAVGSVPQPNSTYLNGGAAYYQVYGTLDGRHVALGAIEPKFWAAFCMAAERPEWVARQTETEPQHQLIADVAALIGSMPLDACLTRFVPADCCFSPVLDLGEALASPQYRERGLVRPAADGALQALFPARIDGAAPPSRPKLRPADLGTRLHEEAGTSCPT